MKSAGKARNNGLYRHIRTSKEIIRNLLNDYTKNIGLGVAKDFTYTWCNLDGCYPRNDLAFTAFAPGEEKASTLIFMPNIKRTLANMKLRYQ